MQPHINMDTKKDCSQQSKYYQAYLLWETDSYSAEEK